MHLDLGNLLVLGILAIAVVGHNNSVAIAAALVLLIKLLGLGTYIFPYLDKNGIQIGVVILTAAILIPLASGRISAAEILASLSNVRAVLAIVVGVLIAYLAGRGVGLLTTEPQVITGIIIGTVAGVAFFKGVSVGPLIGSGVLVFLYKLLRL